MSNELEQTQSHPQTVPGASSAGRSTPASASARAMVRGTEGYDAQAAMLGPVQRRADKSAQVEQHADKAAAAPGVAEKAGGASVQRRAIQRMPVQRLETPSATPHRDAALTQVGSGSVGSNETTTETDAEPSAPVITVPQAYDPYCAHIRDTFSGEIATLQQMQEDFKKETAGVQAEIPRLTGTIEKQKAYEAELAKKKEALTEEEKKRKAKLDMMAQFDGKTMEDLHSMAVAIVAEQAKAQAEGKANKHAMEGVMNAAMALLSKVDPKSGEYGRILYTEKIDKEENGRLVAKAEQQGMAPAETATLAVNYRTWARVWMRDEIMLDETCAEILFMRDLVKSGREAGESPATIIEKVFMEKRGELGLTPEDTFDQATEEQKLAIYQGMIDSAKKTNDSVNDTMAKK